MKVKKLIVTLSVFALTCTGVSGYEAVDCTSDPSFDANSCDQCFSGGNKDEGDNIGFLSDSWINNTDISQLLYKEEQEMPYMVNLDANNVLWSQTPSADDFWEYTEELDTLYSDNEEGYVLPAGDSVSWLKSKLGYAYSLDANDAPEGSNIGLLVYPVSVHNILSDGDITIDNSVHNECVLYKAGTSTENPVTPKTPKKLPETGAEHVLLIILALILGFIGLKMFRRA